MKKSILLIIAALSFLVGCSGEESPRQEEVKVELSAADFSEGNHKRSGEYLGAFKTRFAELESITVNFAENVFDENIAPELGESIAGSYYSLRSLSPETAADIELYAVSMTTTGGPVLLGNRLYVAVESVETGEYLPWLAECVFGTGDYWKSEGLVLYAEKGGEDEMLGEDIGAYMKKNPDSGIFSLQPCYFIEEFAAEENVSLAKRMACSLAGYIIEEEGFESFLKSGNESNYLRAWLESMGLEYDTDYLDTPGAEYLEDMEFSVTGETALVLAAGNYRLNIDPVDWLPDAETVHSFLLDFCTGAEQFYARLERDAPEFFSHLAEAGEITDVWFRDSDYPMSSQASMLKNEAVVTDDADALHEICHTLMPRAAIEEACWLCEGLATYLTAPYVSYRADSIVVDSVLTEHEGDTEEDRAFRAETVRCFEKLNGCSIRYVYHMEQPVFKIYEASGYAAFLNPGNSSTPAATQSIKGNYGERHGNSIKGNYPGNELSYLKSMLFVEWLTDKYGLETVIAAEMYKENYFELFPSADAFAAEFEEFWTVRVEPLKE